MTFPKLNHPHDKTAVSEIANENTHIRNSPDDNSFRVFHIEYGPRDSGSPELNQWITRLIVEEFADMTVTGVEKDKLYTDESYADWNVTVEYTDSDMNVYEIPVNNDNGVIQIEGDSPDDALRTARSQFDQSPIEIFRRGASLTLTISLPETSDEVTIVEDPKPVVNTDEVSDL